MQRKINIIYYRKFKKAWETLKHDFGRDPEIEEISSELGQEVTDQLKDCIDLMNSNLNEFPDDDKFQIEYRQSISNYELKKARIKLGLTQKQIAERLGIDSQVYGNIENFWRNPTNQEIQTLSELFGYDANRLFPDWTKFIVENRKAMKSSMVVEIGKIALNNPEVLALEEPSQDLRNMEVNDLIKNKLQPLLDVLSPRERKILDMRFGLTDGVSHTLEEVGQEFGVTCERMRQIEAKALDKIKYAAETQDIDLSSFISGELPGCPPKKTIDENENQMLDARYYNPIN